MPRVDLAAAEAPLRVLAGWGYSWHSAVSTP